MKKKTKIVIVGGGSAGWLTAGYLSKFHKNYLVEVVESENIPTIGVGESVTPHVDFFLTQLGIDRHHWMKHTNSVYKLANKFTNWVNNQGETEYISFNYTTPAEKIYCDINKVLDLSDLSNSTELRTTDLLYSLIRSKKLNKFDKYFNPQFPYMESNKTHYKDKQNVLNQFSSVRQHINAEEVGNYIKEFIAIPNGVKHTKATIKSVSKPLRKITHLVTQEDTLIEGDIFIDCTGFNRLLMKEYTSKLYEYKNNPINKSIVAQSNYIDPKQELVNYTQSIARDNGWQFKIGLYNRMGNGYCYSDTHEHNAEQKFKSYVTNLKNDPREISWTPGRLEKPARANTASIGLSSGFVEPLEANALYTIITGILLLSETLKEFDNSNELDWTNFNEKLTHTIDDIADFLLVHYTLSQRTDTDFWKDMSELGNKLQHKDLLLSKYNDIKNTMMYARKNYTMFPDYMWIQLASHYNINLETRKVDSTLLELAQLEFEYSYNKHKLVSESLENNYVWHQRVIFDSVG